MQKLNINLVKVSVSFGDFLLDIKDVSIKAGQKVAILGENGSGKTTLLNTLAGLSENEIYINKQKIYKLTPKRRAALISYLPQFSDISFDKTVFDLVLLGRYALSDGRFAAADLKKTQQILDIFGIQHLRDRFFSSLSGGQKRVVLIAKTINQESGIVLLDEPFSGVDVKNTLKLLKILKSLNSAVIASVHDVNIAIGFFDLILLLKQGRLLYFGKSNLISKELIDEAYGIESRICSDRYFFY
ncbi:ABC transporter ATP-binding protein [Hippea jasoniae]|uniref:ABC transporter ATP-binding protein n=1 Tax=Hippea jasoniae TaxID=944479 RepID=UPI00054E6C06|nr:ABC transporter ATP-binding protein [Hippea jasoniae]